MHNTTTTMMTAIASVTLITFIDLSFNKGGCRGVTKFFIY